MIFVSLPQFSVTEACMFIYAAFQPMDYSDIRCDNSKLNGDNYKVWKERILLNLRYMDIDYAIRKTSHKLLN